MLNLIQKGDGALGFKDEDSNEPAVLYPAASTAPTKGTPTGGTITMEDTHFGNIHKTVLTFDAATVAFTDEAGVVAYAGLEVLTFPEGAIMHLGSVADLDYTKSSAGVNDTWDGDVALGTVTASNNATLATTEQDLIPTTATPQAVAGATTANALSTATEVGTVFDGTTTAIAAFLVDDADHDVTGTAANLIIDGTLTINWMHLGDF